MSRQPLLDNALLRQRRRRSLLGRAGDAPLPFLFQRAAEDMADRLASVRRSFGTALVGGAAARPVAAAIAGAGDTAVIRHDTVAEGFAPDEPGVVAAADRLPFPDASLDLVVSAMALHAEDDVLGAFRECRRVLRPDGLFLACFFGGDTLAELRRAFLDADAEGYGGAGVRVQPAIALSDAGALLQAAGFALPVADRDPVSVRYPHVLKLFADIREMGLTSALVERSRRPLSRAHLARVDAAYRRIAGDPDGRLRATFDVISLSGWAPHPSQQKPLKPGSATHRLADALNDRSPLPG